jgi:uncharacterized protein (UPF0305 family)
MKTNESSVIREIYEIRSAIHEETKGMSPKERADFINHRVNTQLAEYNTMKASGTFSPVFLDAPQPIQHREKVPGTIGVYLR